MYLRFFVEPGAVDTKSGTVVIKGKDCVHISASLRLKRGAVLTLCDNSGTDYACKIEKINAEGVFLSVINSYPASTEPDIKFSLFQAYPKSGKMDFIIEKCVELGVFEVIPVITRYTEGGRGSPKTERLNRVAAAAAKQCNRAFVPKVHEPLVFSKAIVEMKSYNLAFAAWERERSNKIKNILQGFNGGTAAALIGPEGGFSDEEAAAFTENNIPTVNLGKRILRTETAGLTCITIFFNETGEF